MVPSGAKWGLEMRGNEHRCKAAGGRTHARPAVGGNARAGPLNEVVCGAMMLAYERAGKWNEVWRHAPLTGPQDAEQTSAVGPSLLAEALVTGIVGVMHTYVFHQPASFFWGL